jgi:hypothetical protein
MGRYREQIIVDVDDAGFSVEAGVTELRRQLGESPRATPADAHPCDRPAVRTLVFALTALEGAYRRHHLRLSDYLMHRRDLSIRLGNALGEVYDLYFANFAKARAPAKAATKRTKAKRRRKQKR